MNRALIALLLTASVAAVAQDPKAKPAAKPATAAAPAPAAKPAPAKAPAPASAILGNKDSKTFHRPDCKNAAHMKEANKVSFASAADATKVGYKACKVCKP